MALVGEPEGKLPLRESIETEKDSIKINFQEVGLGNVAWIHRPDSDQWRAVANVVINARITQPQGTSSAEELAAYQGLSSLYEGK
jgi:hypothetical protein